MAWGEPTIINYDWYGTLLRNLNEEGLQSVPVGGQNAGEVPRCNHNHILCAGLSRLFAQLDGLTSTPSPSPSNDRRVRKPSIVQSLPSGLDQSNPIGVRQV